MASERTNFAMQSIADSRRDVKSDSRAATTIPVGPVDRASLGSVIHRRRGGFPAVLLRWRSPHSAPGSADRFAA